MINLNLRKKRIFEVIQIGNKEDIMSRTCDFVIVMAIILNIIVLFAGTFEEMHGFMPILKVIEAITVVIFCIEYVIRVWTAEYLYPDAKKISARLKFIFSFEGIIDIFTILPFFFLLGFSAFRMLKVVRIFHLFRLNAHYDSFNVITTVLWEKKNQIVSSIFIIVILMLASSLSIYSAEHGTQPGVFKNAFSGMWWSMSTIFTVGYGDIYPVTTIGRLMAVIITFLGVGAVAIPTGIISAGFVENYTKMQKIRLNAAKNKSAGNIIVEKKSKDIGKLIAEIEENYRIDIVVVLRDGVTVLATDDVRVKAGDVLIYREI